MLASHGLVGSREKRLLAMREYVAHPAVEEDVGLQLEPADPEARARAPRLRPNRRITES